MPAVGRRKKDGGVGSFATAAIRSLVDFLRPGNLKEFLLDPCRISPMLAILILVAEVIVNFVVIHKVKYTEIDWVAYMQVMHAPSSMIT